MIKLNAFLIIGCIGLIVTAISQFVLPSLKVNMVFPGISDFLYPICLALIVIGFGMMLKVEKHRIDE